MHLLIRRSQRDDGWIQSSITFILNVRLDLDAEEALQFKRYRLHDRVVYNSDDFAEHVQQSDKYIAANEKLDASELGEMLSNSFNALWHNIAGKFELQVTLQSLLDGITIETQDMEEMLLIQSQTRTAAQFISQYLHAALTFDDEEELDEY